MLLGTLGFISIKIKACGRQFIFLISFLNTNYRWREASVSFRLFGGLKQEGEEAGR